jgi:site-specific DNA recombinase
MTAPRSTFANARAPKGKRLLSGRVTCGICWARAYLSGRPIQWVCTARVRGIATSQHCKPAPGMLVSKLDEIVEAYFLKQFGPSPLMQQVFDPGSGHGPRIAQLEADRKRLREDRAAGLYDSADDAAWFREVYASMGQELDELRKVPVRQAALRWVRTGETVADEWHKAEGTERRGMLARYGVKAVVFPRGYRPRVWVHCLDETAEASALDQISAEREREQEADYEHQAWQRAQQESKLAFASIILDRDTLDHAAMLGGPSSGKHLAYIDAQLRDLGIDPDCNPFA